jgi:hypothetical protein
MGHAHQLHELHHREVTLPPRLKMIVSAAMPTNSTNFSGLISIIFKKTRMGFWGFILKI